MKRRKAKKAFLTGRWSVPRGQDRNPYLNPKLMSLWERGRKFQLETGNLPIPVPPSNNPKPGPVKKRAARKPAYARRQVFSSFRRRP